MRFLKKLLLIALALLAIPNVVFGQQLVLKNILHDMEGPNSLLNTRKVVVTRSGNIAVATDGRVRVFSPTGVHLYKFGTYGHGLGQFGYLYNLVELSNNKWLIVFSRSMYGPSNEVLIFDVATNSVRGVVTTDFGASGYCRGAYSRADGQFGLLYDNGVLRYREDGTLIAFTPHSIDVDSFLQAGGTTRGEFIIASRLPTQIKFEIYNPETNQSTYWYDNVTASGGSIHSISGSDSIHVVSERIYGANNSVRIYGINGGVSLKQIDFSAFGVVGELNGKRYVVVKDQLNELDLQGGLKVIKDGSSPILAMREWALASDRIYATDWNQLFAYDRSGNVLNTWSSFGSQPGQISSPNGMVVAANGNLVIADTYNDRLQVWDSQYVFKGAIGGKGSSLDGFWFPYGMSRFPDGRLVVADTLNKRIKILTPEGVALSTFVVRELGSGNVMHPEKVACVSSNEVWAYRGDSGVYRYRDDGTYLGHFGIPVWLGFVGAITPTMHGSVMIATHSYIIEYSLGGDLLRVFPKRVQNSPNNDVRHIMTDTNGDIWVVDRGVAIYQYVQTDLSPPTSSHNLSPSPTEFGWTRASTTLTITSTDKAPSAGFKELRYTVDSGTEQVTTQTTKTLAFDDGVHQIAYWGVDAAGNIEATQYATVRIDKVRPVTTRTVNASDTLLTLTPTDNASGIAGTFYSIDGAPQQQYTAPISLDGKQHRIVYFSVDKAGNVEYFNTVLIGVALKSVTLDRTSAVGGYTRTGRIILTGAAPAGGVDVLVWSDTSAATVPVSVNVPANQSSTTFAITTIAVSERTVVTLSATAGDNTRYSQLELIPPSARISATPRTVIGGGVVTLVVTLDGPAPTSGWVVNLSSDNAALLPVPATVTVTEGQVSASVQVTSVPTQERSTVMISASTAAQSALATVLVDAPSPSSITLTPTSVNGGTGATGTVTLNGLAPAGGYEVALTSSSAIATVPASIVIAAGQTTGTFDIATRGVQQNTTVTITATANNVRRVAVLSVRSAAVASVQVSPTTVLGSQSVVGRVNLTTPAPDGGLVVDLTSGNSNVIVPATVRIAAGETFATFDVQTKSVTAQAVATITATFNGASRTTTLTVNALVLQNLSVSSSTIIGGNGLTATVTLSAPAPTGNVSVALTSSSGAVTVPATVTVATGQTTETVDITTVAVTSNINATLTATFLGVSKTANVAVTAPGLVRLTLNPSSVVGGNATTATVDIASPAPANGLVIALSSNRSDVLVPATVTVPAGQSSVSVQVLTKSVTTPTDAVVTATLNGQVVSNVVTLSPYRLASLAVTPSSVSGGSTFTGRVTLQLSAPAGGIVVSLSSSDPAVSIPSTVTIDAGKTTATFAGTTAAVTATKNVTITASLNGNSVTDTLRVVQPGIKSISLSSSTVTGGTGSQLSITLDAPAPVGGWLVNLASSDASATLVTTATVPAGQTTVTVPVSTKPVLTRTAVALTATDASSSQSTTLVVEPVIGLQLRLSSSNIAGGNSVNLTVELAEAAPKTGATVALSADNAALVVPVSIKVLPGSKTATIAVKSLAVAVDTTVRIAGTVNGFTDRAQILVTAPRPQAVTFAPPAVLGGKSSTGSLTLTGPAPVGGLTVQLSSDNAAATVPATVLVPAGKNVATFVVITKAVAGRTPVNISASANGTTVSQQLAVQALTVQSVVLKPSTVVGGTPSIGTVTLNGVAPAGGLQVDLTSGVSGVTVPAKVFVPAGKNIVTFTATTEPVGSNLEVTLTARANGDQVTSTLLVTPVLVSTLTVAPTTVVGGTSATGTVKLAVAPGVDTVVTLSSANPTIASVPATVVVRKGTLTATFSVTTKKPAAQTTVTLSAMTGGAAKIGKVTVKP